MGVDEDEDERGIDSEPDLAGKRQVAANQQ